MAQQFDIYNRVTIPAGTTVEVINYRCPSGFVFQTYRFAVIPDTFNDILFLTILLRINNKIQPENPSGISYNISEFNPYIDLQKSIKDNDDIILTVQNDAGFDIPVSGLIEGVTP